MIRIENISKIDIDISEKDGIICCRVRIPARSSQFKQRLDITTPMVRELLLRKGYSHKVLECEGGAFVSNKSARGPLVATWTFRHTPAPTPRKVVPKRTTKTRTTKKTTTKE